MLRDSSRFQVESPFVSSFSGAAPSGCSAAPASAHSASLSQTLAMPLRLLRRAWFRFVEHCNLRRAERGLMVLSDRDLRDIGLHRTQILSALMEAADKRTDALRVRAFATAPPRAKGARAS